MHRSYVTPRYGQKEGIERLKANARGFPTRSGALRTELPWHAILRISKQA